MRLLIVTQAVDLDDPILGFFHAWIATFATHGDHITVICQRAGRCFLPENVAVYSLGKERGTSKLAQLATFYRLIISHRCEYDAVFVHMNPEYIVLGGLLWRIWGKRIGLWFVHKSVTLWLRVAEQLVDVIFTTSPESFRLPSTKVQVVGHGIDVASSTTHTPSSETIRLVTVGRVAPSKRLMEMLQAVKELQNQGARYAFDIIGDAVMPEDVTYKQSLIQFVRDEGLSDVHFRGAVPSDEVPKKLLHADIFLNLSATGSTDKAVLEACASGLIVLSSNEAFRSLLEPRSLYLQSTDPKKLADAIQTAFARTDKAVLGAALRAEIIRSHDLKALIPRILHSLA